MSPDTLKAIVASNKTNKDKFSGHCPEGMWLPETAVDLESLDLMAEQGIKFVVLDPHQIGRFRKIGEEAWKDVSKEELDIKMLSLCRVKSGRTINIFVHNGPISKDVAFSKLLDNGENFPNRLSRAFSDSKEDQIVSIAMDGETSTPLQYSSRGWGAFTDTI
jgi:alpha-amylase/alpha-mannosidase (GH57 family)